MPGSSAATKHSAKMIENTYFLIILSSSFSQLPCPGDGHRDCKGSFALFQMQNGVHRFVTLFYTIPGSGARNIAPCSCKKAAAVM